MAQMSLRKLLAAKQEKQARRDEIRGEIRNTIFQQDQTDARFHERWHSKPNSWQSGGRGQALKAA